MYLLSSFDNCLQYRYIISYKTELSIHIEETYLKRVRIIRHPYENIEVAEYPLLVHKNMVALLE